GRVRASQRSATGAAAGFFARQERGAQRRSGIARDRLNVNVAEAAAPFERAHQQNILKDAAGKAERVHTSFFAEIFRQAKHNLFQCGLCAAREVGANGTVCGSARTRETKFAKVTRGENPRAVGPVCEVAAIERRKPFGIPREEFSKGFQV